MANRTPRELFPVTAAHLDRIKAEKDAKKDTRTTRAAAYSAGFKAMWAGFLEASNPYTAGSASACDSAYHWKLGWQAADRAAFPIPTDDEIMYPDEPQEY